MRSRCMSLLPRTTLHSDSEQLFVICYSLFLYLCLLFIVVVHYFVHAQFLFILCSTFVLCSLFKWKRFNSDPGLYSRYFDPAYNIISASQWTSYIRLHRLCLSIAAKDLLWSYTQRDRRDQYSPRSHSSRGRDNLLFTAMLLVPRLNTQFKTLSCSLFLTCWRKKNYYIQDMYKKIYVGLFYC
jgi:hypothetical protein